LLSSGAIGDKQKKRAIFDGIDGICGIRIKNKKKRKSKGHF